MTGWPANPKLVRHLKSNLIRTCVHVDEAVMGLSVHADGDGEGENPLLRPLSSVVRNHENTFCNMQFLDCEKYWFTISHPERMKAVGWCAVVSSPYGRLSAGKWSVGTVAGALQW